MDHNALSGDAPQPPIGDQLSVIISRQDASWQRGEPLSIEQLLDTLPSKSPDGRELLDLICNEVYLRQLSGESPMLKDYQQRFPAFANVIAIQWQIDGFLDDFVASDDSTSRAAIENEESVNQNELTKLQATDETLQPTPPLHGVPPELIKHPNYRLKRQIGRGGMGTVWLAEQLSMRRLVALKLIRPELAAKPESIARFRRELQAVARLRHPNIVTAHDAGNVGETHFLVFEYIEGLTLAKCVEKVPLGMCEACTAVRDAALGLVHAHAAGLVHRDIKPGNLILDDDGLVKVLDFGLVVEPSDDSSITGENIVMGTPDYISPEQANDPRLADARSDIYSLGCTLYHLLSGRAPFKGMSQLKKLDSQRFMTAEPVPNIPQSLQEIVSKMMAKRAEDRYQSASEVVAAIAPFCSPQLPIQPPAVSKLLASDNGLSRRSTVVASAGILGILLLLNWSSCAGPKKTTDPQRSIALTEPSGFADGSETDIEIVGNRLTLNAMNRDQVWLNYQQVTSSSLEIFANVRFLETRAPEPIVKFVFQSCEGDFHEYFVQFRVRESSVELLRTAPNRADQIIGRANVDLKLGEPREMRFRIDETGLSLKVDGEQILRGQCQRTKYYACVAALYCSVEVSNSRADELAQ